MAADIFDDSNGWRRDDGADGGVNLRSTAVWVADQTASGWPSIPTPVAADECADPARFWSDDPVDRYLPRTKGWITDVVYYYRGREVAKIFMYWAALVCLTGAIKREAWVEDVDGRIFTNLYGLIVGESGSGKNTATDFVKRMLDYFEVRVRAATADPNIPKMKMMNPITEGMTRAALMRAIAPGNQRLKQAHVFKDPTNEPIPDGHNGVRKYWPTSEAVIVQEEMSTFMNRQLFMEDLLPWLIAMYDPKDRYAMMTKTDGPQELRNTLITMLGNTTPVALKNTLPAGVQNDGFLSRCLLIYQDHSDHVFSRKRVPVGAPDLDELATRLGWLAANTFGVWKLTDAAWDWYDGWYKAKKVELSTSGIMAGVKSRHRDYVIKLAALIRWQEYDRSNNLIDVCHLEDAVKILEYTIDRATPST